KAVESGTSSIDSLLKTPPATVRTDTLLADLFSESAQTTLPLPVLDASDRLVGTIPRVTLLNALDSTTSALNSNDRTDEGANE
ncbi:MAG TPA: glycine betaine ABC transporter ATP-binding protein, partial [Nocardioidaceae bacterium]|nr:glycine betaine ABC transporter ATP-binding protein [Nocardioidaceae bacterium]